MKRQYIFSLTVLSVAYLYAPSKEKHRPSKILHFEQKQKKLRKGTPVKVRYQEGGITIELRGAKLLKDAAIGDVVEVEAVFNKQQKRSTSGRLISSDCVLIGT